MPSSSRALPRAGLLVALLAVGSRAHADPAQGFALERLYSSAPGAGWVVMDALDMQGGLGGALSFSAGYARNPLRVTDGAHHLAVVSDQALADVGAAVTCGRWRAWLDLPLPIVVQGDSGTVGDSAFAGPSVDPGSNPDTVADTRIGVDVRLVGGPASRLRLGAGAQLIVPSGSRSDYLSDGSFRGMARLLAAGDLGGFTFAAHVGVHLRPLDDSPTAGSPRGSELLFGVAAGARLPVGHPQRLAVVVGPEVYGATAFTALFGSNETALEALLSGRVEGTGSDGPHLRVKLGVGGGLHQRFGAPEWRVVLGVEVFDRLP